MENLIIVAIFIVGSIIYNWIQRKQEEAEQREASREGERRPPQIPPQQGQPGRSRQSRSGEGGGWEEELRRLLQGEAPVQPPAPPPLIKPVSQTAPPRPVLARSSIPVPETGREMEFGLPVRTIALDQASAAHERASHLQAAVVQRMQETMNRVSTHKSVQAPPAMRRNTSADRLRSLLRQKESQRTIILASVILGPPRANEP